MTPSSTAISATEIDSAVEKIGGSGGIALLLPPPPPPPPPKDSDDDGEVVAIVVAAAAATVAVAIEKMCERRDSADLSAVGGRGGETPLQQLVGRKETGMAGIVLDSDTNVGVAETKEGGIYRGLCIWSEVGF